MKLAFMMASLLLAAPFATQTHAGQNKAPVPPSDYASRPAPPISAEARRDMEAKLSEARTRFEAEPNNPDALIWVGRRLSYLGHFSEAVETYTAGSRSFLATLAFTVTAVTVTSPYENLIWQLRIFRKPSVSLKVCPTRLNLTVNQTRATFPLAHYSLISGITWALLNILQGVTRMR